MRFLLTAVVWVVIFGLISFIFSLRGAEKMAEQVEKQAHIEVSFEITPTFAVEKDPFALDIGEDRGAFEIMLDGKTILSKTEGIKDRVSFTTDTYDLTEGKHELFIKANPSSTGISNAVRIKALVHGNPVSDETFWFEKDQVVNAAHIFELEIKGGQDEH